ncbi:MAG: FAD:protein FMN transferase [Myxococcales bacterium]|nr:FAD:protein FMN transferase [Myxococcales bacterium]
MIFVLLACGSGTAADELQVLHGEAFGTTWTVKWVGAEPSGDEVRPAVEAALDQVDQRMSTWRDDSELQAVRGAAGPVGVSAETAEVVRAALDIAQATRGAFDPTVEPLMELWGFRGSPRSEPPTDDELAEVLGRVGWRRVTVDLSAVPTTVDAGGTALDLSAIAKGHGVDRVSMALSSLGATDHLVEIGGEVRAHGAGLTGDWRLGIDRPEEGAAPGAQLAAIVSLRNAALATSGNYRNAYDAGSTRVVHTMDPRTGRPYDSVVASATVVAPDCRTADGWATALMVLGPEEGMAAVDARPQLEALMLLASADGFVERRSAGIGAWLAAAPER